MILGTGIATLLATAALFAVWIRAKPPATGSVTLAVVEAARNAI